MATNPDFQKLVFKDVEFSWPRLDQTYRFNQHKKESEPCAPTAQNAAWSLSWELAPDRVQAFKDAMRAHYDDCRSRKPSLPEFSGVFGMKEKDGKVFLTARRNGVKSDGEINDPPKVIDIYHEDLADKDVWSGSVGHVRCVAFASTNPQDGAGGISLMLNAVLVSEPKYGGDGFEEDFGAPAERPWGDGKMSENPGDGLDQDIPF